MRPAPGAIVVVSSDSQGDEVRRALLAPFAGGDERAETLVDDGIAMAWLASGRCDVHAGESTVCLVEGAVYELGERIGRDDAGRAGVAAALARAWPRLGDSVLDGLRGDFWLVLWDRRARTGLVAADHMGGHCPRWTRNGGAILVASDVRELLAALPRRPAPDQVSLLHWMAVTEPPRDRTMFEGISRLQAGHLLPLGGGPATPRRYWILAYGPLLEAPRAELCERLLAGLRRAVERRLPGTADASVLLSGGLDSSAVAALAADWRRAHQPAPLLRAYSAVFPDHPSVDEAALIELTTRSLELPWTRIVVRGGSVLRGACDYLATWHEPPTTPNLFFWIPLLERAAASGVEVMLDGEGGDEIFGLSPYLLSDRLMRGRLLSAVSLMAQIPSRLPNPMSRSRLAHLLRLGLKGAVPAGVQELRRRVQGAQRYRPPWMRPELVEAWLSTDTGHTWKRHPGPRWWAAQMDAVTQGLGPTLVYDQSRRRGAMCGLHPRHPLVDVDVVELALRFPPETNFDARFSRPLVREALAGLLPDLVRLRPVKSNFDAVFHDALGGPDLPALRRIVGAGDAGINTYIDPVVVRRDLLDPGPPEHPLARMRWAVGVWRFVMAECWLRAQDDPGYVPGLAEREGLVESDVSIEPATIGAVGS